MYLEFFMFVCFFFVGFCVGKISNVGRSYGRPRVRHRRYRQVYTEFIW
jgi:hypothetical protein